jgi:hypothetical protein
MLEQAMSVGTRRPVEWRQGDAMQLMFADASFDAVVCQFGVMIFRTGRRRSPKRGACSSRREFCSSTSGTRSARTNSPTRDDGARIAVPARFAALASRERRTATTTFRRSNAISRAVGSPRDTRVHDGDRAQPGLNLHAIRRSRIARERLFAREIEARGAARLGEATDVAAAAVARRFGDGAIDGKIQAHVIAVER